MTNRPIHRRFGWPIGWIGLWLLMTFCAQAEWHEITLGERELIGREPVIGLVLSGVDAGRIELRHSGDQWASAHRMRRVDDRWKINFRDMGLEPGYHEFKLLIDHQWEDGMNRPLYIRRDGRATYPPAVYLTWKSDPTTTMTIHWHSDDELDPSSLLYRTHGRSLWKNGHGARVPFPHTARWVHSVELTGLTPNQTYEFRFIDGEEVYRFKTLPKRLDPSLRFVSGGDVYHEIHWMNAMNRMVGARDPAFVVLGGGLAYAGGEPHNAYRWHALLASFYDHLRAPDGRMIPIIAAVGYPEVQGHTLLERPDFESSRRWREAAAPYFLNLFAFPGHPGYGVLDFGEYLSLILLDSMHLNPVDGAQATWLREVLQARKQIPHVFPFYHMPAYPSVHPFDALISAAIREHWVPLFEASPVRLAFEHHDPALKITHPLRGGERAVDGITYVGDGLWGTYTAAPATPEERPYLRTSAAVPHVFEVQLEPASRVVRAIGRNGEVLGSFSQPVLPKVSE